MFKIDSFGGAEAALGNASARGLARTGAMISGLSVAAFGMLAAAPAHADASEVYNGINQLRPCPPVRSDAHLAAAAQRHANDMLAHGVSGHTGSDGSSPQARMAATGAPAGASGEIAFWGTGPLGTTAAALDMWMKSPSHRAIIVDCTYTAAGFAIASDGFKTTIVGDFAA